MKRMICILLSLVLLCCFVACDSKEPEVKEPTAAEKVDEMITKIRTNDEYRYEEAEIIAAEEAYAALSDAEKAEVKNYKELQKKRIAFEYEAVGDRACRLAESAAKYSLKTPSSYKNIDTYLYVYYDENKEYPVGAKVTVYFSGTNSFGGTVDNTYYFARLCDKEGVFGSENLTLTEFDKQIKAKNAIEIKYVTDLYPEN